MFFTDKTDGVVIKYTRDNVKAIFKDSLKEYIQQQLRQFSDVIYQYEDYMEDCSCDKAYCSKCAINRELVEIMQEVEQEMLGDDDDES